MDSYLGIDVGGTFTDAVLTSGRRVWRAKASTSTTDLSRSVLDATTLVAERAGLTLEGMLQGVSRFGLGTTAVTNVLTAHTGVRVGLITTAGFEDSLPIAKGRRVNDGVWSVYPEPIVPRARIIGVPERIDRDGHVLVAFDPATAVEAAQRLISQSHCESIAISFLWSFKNPEHEIAAAAAVREAFPEVPVISGAECSPTIREFERTAYAVLNAYAVAAIPGIDDLSAALAGHGLRVPVLLVHSAGGVMTAPEARHAPITLARSGPAAGVAACLSMAKAARRRNVVACDMGGTSFDVAVITDQRIPRSTRTEVSGLLTSLPMVETESIGAGGGSIAWVDARGMLRVGPQSAGAYPGPACYGRGGTEPTVTDALLLLGFLDQARFLGGDMALDVKAAQDACTRLGEPLGLDAFECAWGIRRLAVEGMATAVRSRLNARGLQAADYALVSYGGCGALFTADLARTLGIKEVLVPELSSVLSAFGAATAELQRERVRSLACLLPGDVDALAKVADELRGQVEADLAADGVAAADRVVHFEADLRFYRQVWELTVPFGRTGVDAAGVDGLVRQFETEYVRRYGSGSKMLGAPVELVTLRAIGTAAGAPSGFAATARRGVRAGTAAEPAGRRRVRTMRAQRGWQNVATYDGPSLRPGHHLAGPALIDERDTTVWVPEGAAATVTRHGTIEIAVGAAEPARRASRAKQHTATDAIELEQLRSQLQAVVDDAADTIERTAISPVVTESKDYSATAAGRRGWPRRRWWRHHVSLGRGDPRGPRHHGALRRCIAPGDVFLANDPYNGGGLHPNDVFVQRPIFADGVLVGWAALSAHLIDMGGMVMGSFAPAATECFQEALRIPAGAAAA